MKLCKCGTVVYDVCSWCYPKKHAETTKQRGYGHDHRVASERYRFEHPLCEYCVFHDGVLSSAVAKDLHHIVSVADSPSRRMDSGNCLSVCRDCHEKLEGDVPTGQAVKRWSVANYDDALNGVCTNG